MNRHNRLPGPYIWLQDDQQVGIAMCGCMVDYDHDQSARFYQCHLHENAELLKHALKNLCLTIECEPRGHTNIMAAVAAAYRVIKKAEEKF